LKFREILVAFYKVFEEELKKVVFCRYFDMGLSHKMFCTLFALPGCNESQRGKEYVRALLKEQWENSPARIPYAIMQILAKWTGYTAWTK